METGGDGRICSSPSHQGKEAVIKNKVGGPTRKGKSAVLSRNKRHYALKKGKKARADSKESQQKRRRRKRGAQKKKKKKKKDKRTDGGKRRRDTRRPIKMGGGQSQSSPQLKRFAIRAKEGRAAGGERKKEGRTKKRCTRYMHFFAYKSGLSAQMEGSATLKDYCTK